MGSIGQGIGLLKASWAVLKEDKELLALPVISGAAALTVFVSLGYPAWKLNNEAPPTLNADGTESISTTVYVLLTAAQVLSTFITIFFNSALVHGANERMSGGNPTVGSSIKGAWQHVGKIFMWSLVTIFVSGVIRAIQRQGGIFASVLGSLAAFAWAVVSFLVLPVLVIEGVGPSEALRRSTKLIKQKWGEGLTGHIGITAIALLIIFPILLSVAAAFRAGVFAVAAPIGIVAVVITMVVLSALSVVFQTALYRYAVGLPVRGFPQSLLNGAFMGDGRAVRRRSVAGIPPHVGAQSLGAPNDSMLDYDTRFDAQGYANPDAAPPVDFSEPQDWSKLPDEWT